MKSTQSPMHARTILTSVLVGLLWMTGANAANFSPSQAQQQIINQHWQLLDSRQQDAEQEYSRQLEAQFEQGIRQKEESFMEQACATYGKHFDNESDTCQD